MAEDLGTGPTQNSEDMDQKRISESHRPDVDWLRVLAVLLLIPFHAAVAFNPEPAAVILIQKQAAVPALIVLEHFLDHWQMQLLFVMAGWSMWFSLAKRAPTQFLAERRDRLLIPFIFGVLVLIPIAMYAYELEVQPNTATIWGAWLGMYTQIPTDLNGEDGRWTPGHLWFIIYLLVITVVLLPFFTRYRNARIKKLGDQPAVSSKSLPLQVIFFPVFLTMGMGSIPFPGKNIFYYGALFVLGFVLAAHPEIQKCIDRLAPHTLYLAAGLFVLEVTCFPLIYPPLYEVSSIPYWVVNSLGGWLWVIGLIGLAHRYIKTGSKTLTYLSESSYPFYILHWVLLSVVAYFIIKLPVLPVVSYLLMVAGMYVATFAAYDLLVRRNRIMRKLFGMRPLKIITDNSS